MAEVTVGDANAKAAENKKLQDAASDARTIVSQSPVVAKLLAVDMICRQLYILVADAIRQELNDGWDVQNVDYVLNVLNMSAHEKAVNTAPLPTELRTSVLTTVLPVLDIFCQMEKENEQQQTVLHGNNTDEKK